MAWKEAEEALKLVQDRRALYRHKWPYVWQWFLNLNFYAGNQWLTYDPTRRQFLLEAQDPDKPRVTENKIQPTVRQAVGGLMRQKLRQICPPDAFDEAAVDKAKVRTRLLEHIRRETRTDAKLKLVATWAALTGSGFARYNWDEDLGPRGRGGKPLGDINMSVVSPFSLIVPPNCLTIEEMPWIMEVTTRSVAWVYEQHGVEVAADASMNAFDQFDARVLNFTSAGAFMNQMPDVDEKVGDRNESGAACNYIMYWERPRKKYPNGRFVIVAGGKVVYPTDEDEAEAGITVHSPSGDLPYGHLRWFDSGFRFWEFGLVEMLVPLQKERNLIASMILDGIKHGVRASIKAPKGSIKKDEWAAEAGAVLEYTPVGGQSPEAFRTEPVHPQLFSRISMIDQDMSDIAGIHFRPPAGVKAAAAYALQQETDNRTSEPVADNVEDFLVRDGKLKLQLARANYKRGRKIRTVGEAMRWEVMEYDAAQIGESDDVEIQNGGQLAQDKVQRLDQVLKLLSAKDAKGEQVIDAYEARRLLDLENSENIDSHVRADMNRARYENSLLEKGQGTDVRRWDNHDVHLREHYLRMKRVDWDELTQEVREAFITHTLAHEQAKAAAAAPPTAPGAPPGAQPGLGQVPPQLAAQLGAVAPGQGQPGGTPSGPPGAPVDAGLKAGMTSVNNVVAATQ